MAVTTLMFRGIPRTLTPGAFLRELQRHVHVTSLDFVYLPWVDGKTHNVGRAFVNFTTPEAAAVAWRAMDGRILAAAPTERPVEVLVAQAQGLMANIAQCQHRLQLHTGSEHDPLVLINGQRASFRALAASLPHGALGRAHAAPAAAVSKSRGGRPTELSAVRRPAAVERSPPRVPAEGERFAVEVRRMRICDVFEADSAELF